jgi:xanthine dehydrogenase accessory factor
MVTTGQVVGYVGDLPLMSSIDGVLRGLLRSGLEVTPGFKTGDVDPRAARNHCFTVSDKALAIGGGVLEAACVRLGGVRFDH